MSSRGTAFLPTRRLDKRLGIVLAGYPKYANAHRLCCRSNWTATRRQRLLQKACSCRQRSDKQLELMRNSIAVNLRNRVASKVNLHMFEGVACNISVALSDPVLKMDRPKNAKTIKLTSSHQDPEQITICD